MKLYGKTAGDVLIPLTVDADGHLQIDLKTITAGNNLIGRVDARDGDKIFSIDEAIKLYKIEIDIAGGAENFDTPTVPAGYIYVINSISWVYTGTIPARVVIYVIIAGSGFVAQDQKSGTSQQYEQIYGTFYLGEGDKIRMSVISGTLDDLIELTGIGYSMKI